MEYIKKAAKTAESDTQKIRDIVQGILTDIEKNGEKAENLTSGREISFSARKKNSA